MQEGNMERWVLFMQGLRQIGTALVALCEDWLQIPYDQSCLVNRRGKVARLPVKTLQGDSVHKVN